MKNIFLVAVLVFTGVQAAASKARVIALGNSFQLVDSQFVYTNPMNLRGLGNFVAIESGSTTSTGLRDNAEALVSFSVSENERLAFGLGKNDEIVQLGRTFMNSVVGAGTYQVSQNPVHLFYLKNDGEQSYGFGTLYSNKDDKAADLTESSNALVASYRRGSTIGFLNYGLVNSVEAAGGLKFEGSGYFRLSGRHFGQDGMSYGADYFNWSAKSSTAGNENQSYSVQTMAVRTAKTHKSDNGSQVFYGLGLVSNKVNCRVQAATTCSTSFTRVNIPVILAFEANAKDWLVVRGSITQSVLHDTSKDEIGLAASSGIPGANGTINDFGARGNTTTVAMGMGLNFNKISLDGVFEGNTNQRLDSNSFMTQVGMTYKF